MTEKPENQTEQEERQKLAARNKRTLYIILIVSIAPIAFAWFTFFTGIGVPDTTSSYGQIINPALHTERLFDGRNRDFYQDLMQNKKWHLFIPVAESCNQACEDILYTTRQVHVRLGEKSARVERVLVHLADTPLNERMQILAEEHPLLQGVALDKDSWIDFIEEGIAQADPRENPYYILVDQEGFAMMYYDANVKGGELLKDLKRALKHSIDYQ